jgi:hypothetical protein
MDTLKLSVGLEIETTGGGENALPHIADLIGIDDRLHSYHCECDRQCSHRFDRENIVTAQNDCSVEMEYITRPIVLGDAGSWQELEEVGHVFRQYRTYANPNDNTGQHVHVGAIDTLDTLPERMIDLRGEGGRISADGREQFAQFFVPLQEALRPYFAASVEDVRDYNHPISRDYRYRSRTGWLNLNRGRKTVEIRGWNGSVVPWRWRMSAGISAAMVAAVMDGARPTRKDKPTLAGVLGKHIDDETRELMSRQMFYRLHNY